MTFVIKTSGAPGLLMLEFACPECGVFEAVVPSGTECWSCECGLLAPWTPSAPKPKVLTRAVFAEVRGGDTERRPGMLDTRPLAEGMSLKEWKKAQEPARLERRHQQMIAKGLKAKRVQV